MRITDSIGDIGVEDNVSHGCDSISGINETDSIGDFDLRSCD